MKNKTSFCFSLAQAGIHREEAPNRIFTRNGRSEWVRFSEYNLCMCLRFLLTDRIIDISCPASLLLEALIAEPWIISRGSSWIPRVVKARKFPIRCKNLDMTKLLICRRSIWASALFSSTRVDDDCSWFESINERFLIGHALDFDSLELIWSIIQNFRICISISPVLRKSCNSEAIEELSDSLSA